MDRIASDHQAGERPLFLAYWGTRGALPRFTLELAEAAAADASSKVTVSISSANERVEEFAQFGTALCSFDLFEQRTGAFNVSRLFRFRRALADRLAADNTRAFVTLMPHVWSPLITDVVRRAGARHVVIVHDDIGHQGDSTGLINNWLLREARAADCVVTLSRYVADQIIEKQRFARSKVSALFFPDFNSKAPLTARPDRQGPLRVMFLGRLMKYKGSELFVDAMELLRQRGLPIQVGMFGAGNIEHLRSRLHGLGAEVVNRWIREDEFDAILARHDLVVASHLAASQSGVIPMAYGRGMPVVATPVGGLVEQVIPDVTGVLASAVNAEAVADAVQSVVEEPGKLAKLNRGVVETRHTRSMRRFLQELTSIALGDQRASQKTTNGQGQLVSSGGHLR